MPPESFARLLRFGCLIAFLLLISFMLQGIGSLLSSGFRLLVLIPVILVSLTFHEYAHARMADFLGDPTPERMGRLSLNPLAHLDFFGTLLLFFTNFGWARPVIVDPSNFRVPQRAMLSVALAGPASNFFLAFVGALSLKGLAEVVKITMLPPMAVFLLLQVFETLIVINLSLALFNLLPIPPLDGGRIAVSLLPNRLAWRFARLEPYGFPILLVLLFTGILGTILWPLIAGFRYLLSTVLGF